MCFILCLIDNIWAAKMFRIVIHLQTSVSHFSFLKSNGHSAVFVYTMFTLGKDQSVSDLKSFLYSRDTSWSLTRSIPKCDGLIGSLGLAFSGYNKQKQICAHPSLSFSLSQALCLGSCTFVNWTSLTTASILWSMAFLKTFTSCRSLSWEETPGCVTIGESSSSLVCK